MEKKQKIILWFSALLITALLGYYKTVTSAEYPVTGTIAVSGEKVTYAFEKIFRGKDDFKISLRTDAKELTGSVVWRKEKTKAVDTLQLKKEKGWLLCSIPLQKPETEIVYNVFLYNKDSVIQIPFNQTLRTKFYGAAPASITSTFALTFFIGLLLSIRIGLSYFELHSKAKMFAIFTLISFSLYGLFLVPVKKLFELGAVNQAPPQMLEMFSPAELSFAFLWLVVSVGMFNSKSKLWNAAGALFTAAGYLLLH